MKLECPYCKEEIELTQSERAKHGFKKFDDHKAECFKMKNKKAIAIMNKIYEINLPGDVISDKGENVTAIIWRLQSQLGRIPTEVETLREMTRIRALKELIKQ